MTNAVADLLLSLSRSVELSLFVKVTILAALGLAAVRFTARARASVRHALLAVTFGSLLILPLASRAAPSIDVPLAVAASSSADTPSFAATPPATPTQRPPAPSSLRAAAPASAAPASGPRDVPARAAGATTLVAAARGVWVAGILACLLPLGVMLWRLHRLRLRALPWPDMRAMVGALAAEAGVSRPVEVAMHEHVRSPVTFGLRRSWILMPLDARTWTDAELRRALIHELEHVRRRDWPVQVLARLACAVYWFHPLVWVARRRMALEAERACDDAVLTREEHVAYAEQLVSLAERLSGSAAQPLLGMANRSDLSTRIAALLDPRQRRGRVGLGSSAGVLASGVLVLTLVAPVRAIAVSPAPAAPGSAAAVTATSDGARQRPRRTRAVDRGLYFAAEDGDLNQMDALVRAGANVNAAIAGDGSPLIAAVRSGRTDAVTWLLDHGADPNLGVPGDGSALIAAARAGDTSSLSLLLDRGADIDKVVPGDENALISASAAGRQAAVRFLVEHHANVNARVWADTFDGRGEWRTPLSMAQRSGNAAVVEYLVAHGARD